MPRPRNKNDLLIAAKENYSKLMDFIDSMTEKELSTPFDFSTDVSKKEAHWSRDKNVRDVLIHLYEWHLLMLKFPENNVTCTDSKNAIAFLPPEYSWKTYGAMNLMFWNRNQSTSLETAKKLFAETHASVIAQIEKYTDEELFTKKHYAWTGGTDLGSYFVSTTSSHYDWALKKLKAHRKNCGK
ncbi:MAG: ClbS/DfsB family four-helix bundle protein [Treponema sp.]|nr:ClbS/DfsB family four-helix bundle protein [Treponema sp.]MBQ9630504.1 ClbS/DfsB family four-helix bundle protein [Treponema sp.]